MIISAKDIYEEIAEEENINLELIQSIGNAVFQNLRTCLNDPMELSYELPKIGTFNIRFKKFENYFNGFEKRLLEGNEEAKLKYEENPENFHKNKRLMGKIKVYREDKQQKEN